MGGDGRGASRSSGPGQFPLHAFPAPRRLSGGVEALERAKPPLDFRSAFGYSPRRMNEAMRRVLEVFPAGSNGEFGFPAGEGIVPSRGEGCWVWDEAGKPYVDLSMAWGSAFVGHAHPRLVDALRDAAGGGFNFACVNSNALRLAERLVELSPCLESVRLVTSGTEATMMCLRVARGATGRRRLLRFEGAYHGQHPVGIAGMMKVSEPGAPKIHPHGAAAPWVEDDVLVAPFNDLETTSAILETYASDLAAVIVEPIHRCIAPQAGFLEGLREVTQRLGIVLIFDEVVTGFRLALGGAQEYFGVQPDLVAYGKALGGGIPIGAYGGRASLMEVVSEWTTDAPNYVWSASTTGGGPVTSAVALAVLDVLSEDGVYERAHRLGRELRARMRAVLERRGVVGQVLGDGPIAQVAFSEHPVVDNASYLASDREKGRALMLALARESVFLNPMGTKLYLSLQHNDAALESFERALDAALLSLENN